ncbi:MAG: hypothetical protein LUC27_02890 [Lachnospiraceae bacterium]|nr:hypothetical protein [Lachnospiraceae bacterium]
MQRVNIYIGTDSTALKETTRWTAYVLECEFHGETETRENFTERTGTYNSVVLQTLAEALGRLRVKCELHIYSVNLFVLNTIRDQLPQMAARNFCTKSGTPCKSQEEWRTIWDLIQGHLVVTEPGTHPYSGWMEAQMELLEEQKT